MLAALLASPGAARAEDTVVVGALPLSSSAPLFLAEDLGFFQQEGIRADLRLSRSAAAIAVGVAAGDYDVGATGITAALFNIMMGEAKLKIVADKGRLQPGYHFESIVVSPAAHARGVRSLKDLKGASFGMTTLGSTFHYMLGNLAQQQGLSLADFQLKPLRGLPNMVSALSTGQVDFAIFPEPAGSQAMAKGGGVLLEWVDDKLPYQIAAVFYGGRLLENKDLGLRFMKAYVRGTRAYVDTMLRGPEESPAFQRGAASVAKWTQQPLHGRRGLIAMDRNGQLLAEDIDRQVGWYAVNGFVPAAAVGETRQMLDLSFQAAAVQQLGP
ncbi:MAG TPA: ABC transporter substrate-binding protein [bacterium]|nr:ABC transporter substrate-binding protein [bacterium]